MVIRRCLVFFLLTNSQWESTIHWTTYFHHYSSLTESLAPYKVFQGHQQMTQDPELPGHQQWVRPRTNKASIESQRVNIWEVVQAMWKTHNIFPLPNFFPVLKLYKSFLSQGTFKIAMGQIYPIIQGITRSWTWLKDYHFHRCYKPTVEEGRRTIYFGGWLWRLEEASKEKKIYSVIWWWKFWWIQGKKKPGRMREWSGVKQEGALGQQAAELGGIPSAHRAWATPGSLDCILVPVNPFPSCEQRSARIWCKSKRIL